MWESVRRHELTVRRPHRDCSSAYTAITLTYTQIRSEENSSLSPGTYLVDVSANVSRIISMLD